MKTAVKLPMALFAGAVRRVSERIAAQMARKPRPVQTKEPGR